MATEVITTYGDTGQDYSSIKTWESTEQRDLTTLDEIAVLEGYNSSIFMPSPGCVISGWVTTATNKIIWRAAAGQGHTSASVTQGNGIYIPSDARNPSLLQIDQDWVEINDFQFHCTWGTSGTQMIRCWNQDVQGLIFRNCMTSLVAASDPQYRIDCAAELYNCVSATNGGRSFMEIRANRVKLYNCTFDSRPILNYFEAELYNCVGEIQSTVPVAESSNNAVRDATGYGVNPITNITDSDFVDPVNNGIWRHAPGGRLDGTGLDNTSINPLDINRQTRLLPNTVGAWGNTLPVEVTHTLKETGGDYSTIQTWESTEQRDLVIVNEKETLLTDAINNPNNDALIISGWTTDATRFITVRPNEGQWGNGAFLNGFRMVGNSFSQMLEMRQAYTEVYGISIENTRTASYNADPIAIHTPWCLIDSCILKTRQSVGRRCVNTFEDSQDPGSLVEVRNCYAIGGDVGFKTNKTVNIRFENCTAIKMRINGFESESRDTIAVINCVSVGNGTNFSGSWPNLDCSNNASGTTDAPGANPLNSVSSAAFVDYTSNDLRPVKGDVLDGENNPALDLSTSFTRDVANGERALPWERGAQELLPTTAVEHTLRAAGGDYSLMSTWEATEQRDLVALRESDRLLPYNDWAGNGLDDSVLIDGWTTGWQDTILVEPPAGEGCDGVIDGGFRMFSNAGTTNSLMILYQQYVTVRNIQGRRTSGVSGERGFQCDSAFSLYDGCIFVGSGSYTEWGFRQFNDNRGVFYNCLARNCERNFYAAGIGVRWYNCTSIQTTTGNINFGGTGFVADYRNCVAFAGSVQFGLSADAASTNNASSGTDAPGAAPQNNITNAVFVSIAGADYRAATGEALDNNGADLSTLFDTDIQGLTRVVPWTIGAYREGEAGGTPPTDVEAGGPYSGDVSTPIQLSGSFTPGSDPVPTLLWIIQSGGTGTFSDDSIANPTFTPDDEGAYVLRFLVAPNDTAAVFDDATLNSLGEGFEMYVQEGGVFKQATPYVVNGGVFQEVTPYILEGGQWKPV